MINEAYTPLVLPCSNDDPSPSNPCQRSFHLHRNLNQQDFEGNERNSELEVSCDVPGDHFKTAWERSVLSLYEFRFIMVIFMIIGIITTIKPVILYYTFPILIVTKFIENLTRKISIEVSLDIQFQ